MHQDLFVICDLSVGCTHFAMFPDPGYVSLLVQLTFLYSFSDNLSLAQVWDKVSLNGKNKMQFVIQNLSFMYVLFLLN